MPALSFMGSTASPMKAKQQQVYLKFHIFKSPYVSQAFGPHVNISGRWVRLNHLLFQVRKP